MTNGHYELANCENVLVDETEMKGITRKSIALTYAMAMCSSECDMVDWGRVNKAIIERWSFSGLEYVKERAWKIMEGKIEHTD